MKTFLQNTIRSVTIPFVAVLPMRGTISVGTYAHTVDDRRFKIYRSIGDSQTFGAANDLRARLNGNSDFVRKRMVAGWRGYDSQPISAMSLSYAVKFIDMMPFDIKTPVLGVCNNGHVFFRWRRSASRQLTVAIDDGGIFHCSIIHGENRVAKSTNSSYDVFQSVVHVYE